MLRNEGHRLRRVVVSSPGEAYFEPEDLEVHNLTARVDGERAASQHAALSALLMSCGAEVIAVPALEGHPNSVFTQDTALATPQGFLRMRMGLPTRRGEEGWMAALLRSLGEPEVGEIKSPGTAEGGDVILAGAVAFVGRSSRTNGGGTAQLAAYLHAMGYEVRVATVPSPALHIGGMMSVVGPEEVLACEGAFPPELFAGFELLSVPKNDFISGNVITLGEGEVIVAARATATADVLRRAGFRVHTLDLSEFVKGTGGPSCLVLPLERR
ncbi:MAG: dimethylarginine dimethylaminohydrolase family protein [Anaerolineales bacterium]